MSIKTTITIPKGWEIIEGSPLTGEVEIRKIYNKTKCWKDLDRIEGWYVDGSSGVIFHSSDTRQTSKNIFATEEQAKASIAMAQLSQLMKHVNGDWIPDWGDCQSKKYSIRLIGASLTAIWYSTSRAFLAFPTVEIRDTFLKNHEGLIMAAEELL